MTAADGAAGSEETEETLRDGRAGGWASATVEDITELDLNPVFVRRHGAVVADVRVRIAG